jgi:hypothetical protein
MATKLVVKAENRKFCTSLHNLSSLVYTLEMKKKRERDKEDTKKLFNIQSNLFNPTLL